MSLHVAFCLWGLPDDPAVATAVAASVGFQSVDVRPGYGSLAASDRTMPVTCMAVAHLMPQGAMLDATSEPARQLAVDHVRAGILEAQSLGVPDVYLAPPGHIRRAGAGRLPRNGPHAGRRSHARRRPPRH